MPDQNCPHDSKLQELACGSVAEQELAKLEEHLSSCEDCQHRLQMLSATPEFLATTNVAPPQSDSLLDVMARLKNEPDASSNPLTHSFLDAYLQPSENPNVLGHLGGYEVISIIGKGGMGLVAKAVDQSLDRIVAMKFLLPEFASRAGARERFIREAKAAASLQHPHVVTVHAADDSNDWPYIVMEFVDGETLTDLVRTQRRLPWQHVALLALDILKGLEIAHRRGLVHRDIKPSNVLIDRESGAAKITDFGLVKVIDEDRELTASGTIAGTPEFMSPEQAAAQLTLDARSDLFSLGAVLYFALTGESPFRAPTMIATLRRVCDEDHEPLTEIVSDVPVWLANVVHCLLEKSPKDRYANAKEVSEEIQRHLTPAPTPGNSATTSRRRWTIGVAISASLLAFVAIFGPQVVRQLTGPRFERGFVVDNGNMAFDTLSEAIEVAPDGATIDVYGSHEYETDFADIGSKSLTIRAALGSQPRFVPSLQGEQLTGALKTDGTLRLEGIQFRWQVDARSSPQRATIFSSGKLFVANCEFYLLGRGAALGISGSAKVINSKFHATDASGIITMPSDTADIEISNCLFQGRVAVALTSSGETESTAKLTLKENTIQTNSGIQILPSAPGVSIIAIHAYRNRFDVSSYVFGYSGIRRNASTDRLLDHFKRRFRWDSEQQNEYVNPVPFFALQQRLNTIYAIDEWTEWLTFWELDANTETANGVGAQVASLGVGAAYDTFRSSAEYSNWAATGIRQSDQ